MRKRTKARELALKALYLLDSRGILPGGSRREDAELNDAIDGFWEGHKEPDDIKEFASMLVRGVCAKLRELDAIISENAQNWTLDRMTLIDRNILRMAAYEISFVKDTPYKVTINEAIELAKRYGDENSPGFVNGVIDSVRKTSCAL